MFRTTNSLITYLLVTTFWSTLPNDVYGRARTVEATVGQVFTQPFRASVKTRQRCIHADVLGCAPNEPSEPEGKRRHLLVTDDDGDLWMDFAPQETVSTGKVDPPKPPPAPPCPPPPEGCPANSVQTPILSPEGWTLQGQVTLNGVVYKNYTTDYYAVAKFANQDDEQSKLFLEAGMVPNFYEYLEVAADGTPFRMREYNTAQQQTRPKLYRETLFQSVTPLTDDEVDDLKHQEAHNEARRLREKLQTQRYTSQVANGKHNAGSDDAAALDTAPSISSLRGVNRRRALTLGGGLTLPAGCDKMDSFFCFSLRSSYDTTAKELTTDLSLLLGGKQQAGKMSKGGSVSILGQFVVGDGGELKKLTATASGCVEVAKDIGLGAVGIEICAQGALRMIPKESLSGRIEFWTAAFFEVFGLRLSVKVVGGELAAQADYINGMYRMKDISGLAWKRFNFFPAYVGVGVAVKAWPHDVARTDNWQTDIYFTPFAGIDLFLWSTEARWHFKIAQVGPEKRNPELADSVTLQTVDDADFCEPQCIIERTGQKYIRISLPGGKPDDTVPFAAGSLTSSSSSVCLKREWSEFEYTCAVNPTGSWTWQRPTNALQQFEAAMGQCTDDMSNYSAVVDEVGQGQQALSYGDYNYPNAIAANLDICGDFPTYSESSSSDVDRIIKVEAWTGTYWFNNIVWKIKVTYRRKNGSIGSYSKGEQQGSYHRLDVPEGHYITKVEWRKGKYVDAVKFCLSNGYCTPRWGGGGGGGRVNTYSGSVISFFQMSTGRQTIFSPWVVNNLSGFVYQTNRVEKIVLGDDIAFNLAAEPVVDKVLDESSMEKVENCGDYAVASTKSYSIAAKSVETATVSSFDGDYKLEFPKSATFFLSGIDPLTGSPVEYQIGRSLLEGSDRKYESPVALTGTFDVTAQPGQQTEAVVAYHDFLYDYHWTASAKVHFADGRKVDLVDFKGRVYGSRVMSSFVELNSSDANCPADSYTRPVYLRSDGRPMRKCRDDHGGSMYACDRCGPQGDAYPVCQSGYVVAADDCATCVRV